MAGRASGHRIIDHTADVIVEAWGPDLPACLEAAAGGLIATVIEPRSAIAAEHCSLHIDPAAPDRLLLRLLDEVVLLIDTGTHVPVSVEVVPAVGGGFDVAVHSGNRDEVVVRGAVPKGVSRSDLAVEVRPTGVRCRFIVDV